VYLHLYVPTPLCTYTFMYLHLYVPTPLCTCSFMYLHPDTVAAAPSTTTRKHGSVQSTQMGPFGQLIRHANVQRAP
jgi:hypothetical protein